MSKFLLVWCEERLNRFSPQRPEFRLYNMPETNKVLPSYPSTNFFFTSNWPRISGYPHSYKHLASDSSTDRYDANAFETSNEHLMTPKSRKWWIHLTHLKRTMTKLHCESDARRMPWDAFKSQGRASRSALQQITDPAIPEYPFFYISWLFHRRRRRKCAWKVE